MVTVTTLAEFLHARLAQTTRARTVRTAGQLQAVIEHGNAAVTHDSRRVRPGGLFVAITGARTDGNLYVEEALRRGALAIISDKDAPADFSGIWLKVADARRALAQAAALVNEFPARRLELVGITGTNGKTTTAHLVEAIFNAAGGKAAMMGTINQRIGTLEVPAEFTTPEASEVQNFLRRAVEAGCTQAVMEVSSHALALHRADQLDFACAAFTNLTQDHLDLHGTMEQYFLAKQKLFDGSTGSVPRCAVINADDAYGQRLLSAQFGKTLTYGLRADADIHTTSTRFGLDGLHFTVHTPAGDLQIDSPLVGRPFVYNILCAIGIGVALGIPNETIVRGINGSRGAVGRFEVCSSNDDDVTVIVDYAHTADALENVLQTVRGALHDAEQVITVMGCGGDRDKTKRPLMGTAAGKLSDLVIITSDNPRSEDPQAILAEIEPGVQATGTPYEMIVERRTAIEHAIVNAAPRAVILLAGKGHENYQVLASGKIHFDDREEARRALQLRREQHAA